MLLTTWEVWQREPSKVIFFSEPYFLNLQNILWKTNPFLVHLGLMDTFHVMQRL